jgi:hypothetical protein
MWIQEFHKLFAEATECYTGRRQDLTLVECEVADARGGGPITAGVLRAIEESSSWDYPRWWPRLSMSLKQPVGVPPDLSSSSTRREALSQLYDRLQHIEVVSVVMRFTVPQEFGIISPPVAHLLALPPERDHVAHLLTYESTLKAFREHYEKAWRVADVDMALWSAAHLQSQHPALAEEMYRDEFFQEARLGNLLGGLGKYYRRTQGDQIILAKAMLKTDYKLAAVVAGKVHDVLRKNVTPDEFAERGITREGRAKWKKQRNRAMHENPALSKKEAIEFVHDIAEILRRLESA